MWPAKLPGEGARMYDACEAMSVVMKQLGIAVDGGESCEVQASSNAVVAGSSVKYLYVNFQQLNK